MEMRKEETVTADSFDVELSDEAFEENDTVQSALKLYFREIRGKKILDGITNLFSLFSRQNSFPDSCDVTAHFLTSSTDSNVAATL